MTEMATTDKEFTLEQLTLGKNGNLPNFRERSGLDTASLKELADSIADKGILDPFKIWYDSLNKLNVVLDGERRALALQILAKDGRLNGMKIPAKVFTCDRAEALGLALEAYVQRRDVGAYELAVGIDHMQEAAGEEPLSYEEIAKRIKKSKSWVARNYGSYRRAGELLRKAWGAGKIPSETAFQIADLPLEEQDSAVEEQLAMRAKGSKKDAGKARSKAKKEKRTYNAGSRPSIDDVRSELGIISKAFECENLEVLPMKKIEDPYARGVVDALRYMNGNLDYGDFGGSYQKFRESCLKINNEAEEEETPKAEEEEAPKPVKKPAKKTSK